ncbi:DUF4279 domain-containing protein [Micromonospora musae]|uniref:DUF4279 domain-containing protein n=1 Tax=Micromonospora musae TaxID=1894970 RepID=A0A3A9Y9X0_9ACTN|nr:DUF4279 domain-containing protein [Micromonospora musae]RKN22131.1 DUF4279 domain-containing protein [Micromonospora musae]RKN33892.1 DUF4279 domain-containing protein [Micromonospora musae]
MLISQYAYFALKSASVPASEIAARLGIESDGAVIRGSRRPANPVIPAAHCWQVVCRTPGMTVDEQISHIVDRLFVHAPQIGVLAAELDRTDGSGSAVLQVVRVFEPPAGEPEDLSGQVDGLEKLPGQHQLLGWHVDRRTLEFLRLTGAELDIDEYAYG